MSLPSADREKSTSLAAEEASDSEYEYEEIIEEVEEEEFVYEEVEVEEDEVEEEVDEELEEDAGEKDDTEEELDGGGGAQEDLIQNLTEEKNDGNLISCSSTAGTCQSSLLSNVHLDHDSSQPGTSHSTLPSQSLDEKLTTSNEDPKSSKSLEHQLSPVNCESRLSIEDKDGELQLRAKNPYFSDVVIKKNNHYLHNGDATNAETGSSSHLSENKRSIPKTLDDHHGAENNDVLCSAEEVKQKDTECHEESKNMDSSFVDCGAASRNLTPVVEFPGSNKRRAIICNFFAKGWCVRGSSCKFVHVKDSVDSSDQPPRGIGTSHYKQDGNGEGQREDKLRLSTMLDMVSVGGKSDFPSSLSSERIFPYSGSPVDFQLPKYEDGFFSRYGHAGRDSFSWSHHDDHKIHASSSDGINSSVSGRNLLPRYRPSPNGSIMSLSINDNQMPSSHGAIMELKGGGQIELCNNPLQLPLRHSLNSSLHPSSLETSPSVSPNASYLGANKRMKFTPYNWELSVPFRPSFSLASLGITIPGIQYDRFHDSIEKPSAGGASVRLASRLETSEGQFSGDIGGNHVPGSENDGHSGTSQSRVNEQVGDRDSHSYGKDTCTVVAETAENSIVDCQNENIILEESSRPMYLGKSRSDQVSLKKASKDDRVRHKIENKGTRDSDVDMQHEPKSLKYFRFSLVELVKVLLRPTWHEGRLTKDEHNMIVKKAVDKVVSTVLLDQIPSTKEATKQYLSLSQTKIAKLVEGYVQKYGKSCESRMKASPPAVFEDSNNFLC